MRAFDIAAHVAAFALGVAFGRFAPSSWRLPSFFICVAAVALLAMLAHRLSPTSAKGWTTGQVLFALTALVMGPSGVEVRAGLAPVLFLWTLLFTSGFVLFLALGPSVA